MENLSQIQNEEGMMPIKTTSFSLNLSDERKSDNRITNILNEFNQFNSNLTNQKRLRIIDDTEDDNDENDENLDSDESDNDNEINNNTNENRNKFKTQDENNKGKSQEENTNETSSSSDNTNSSDEKDSGNYDDTDINLNLNENLNQASKTTEANINHNNYDDLDNISTSSRSSNSIDNSVKKQSKLISSNSSTSYHNQPINQSVQSVNQSDSDLYNYQNNSQFSNHQINSFSKSFPYHHSQFNHYSSQQPNTDLMNMMIQSDHLMRTSSSASSASSTSTCSSSISTCSSSDLTDSSSLMNENHLKALIMSAAAVASSSNKDESLTRTSVSLNPLNSSTNSNPNNPALIAAFADQFAYMIRSRSSSVSESSTSSSSVSTSNNSNANNINNSNTNGNTEFIKQMISSYQSGLNNKTQISSVSSHHLLSPSSVKKTITSTSNSTSMTQISYNIPVNQCKSDLKQDELTRTKLNEVGSNQVMSNSATPCKVCGDEASGFHYGVDSCEGCKGFFRRCITQGMNHQCTNNQQCEMTPFSRNSCQFCRLKKCFAVGMSREASRLGRRPKRAKDDSSNEICSSQSPISTPLKQSTILEDKSKDSTLLKVTTPTSPSFSSNSNQNLSQQAAEEKNSIKNNKKDKIIGIQNLNYQAPPFKLEPSSPEKQTNNNLETKDILTKTTSNGDLKTLIQTGHQSLASSSPQTQNLAQIINSTSVGLPNQISISTSVAQLQKETSQQKMQQIEMFTKLISISDKHTSIERTNELEFIRTSIIESHLKIWPTTFEKIRKRYLERPPTRISNSYLPNGNLDSFMDLMLPLIMDVVKFCRYIPGFNQILQHDQVQLLRQGSFEVICVNSFMLVDAQNKLMLTPDLEYLLDQETIKQIPFGLFMSEVFDLGIQVSSMKLSDAEIALFNALLMMNPDRGDLQDKDHVEELQATLLHVLYKHLKYFRNDGSDLFYRLLKLIPAVQEINRKHSEAIDTLSTPKHSLSASTLKPAN